ncbi:MAG: peroxiredoxin [Candidatus Dependentiae bacterium]|nr:peroxiredoxin [Candidatus Dependentiae bacterium]
MKTLNIILIAASCMLLIITTVIIWIKNTTKPSLKSGNAAPSFALPDETGTMRSLTEFRGKKVVLYFYPKDETPGCTQEACDLRDAYAIYKEHNITILGISYDSPASHTEFKAKYHLPFSLLSDTTHTVAHAYGADQHTMGHFFPKRMTILIDEQGNIVHTIEDVSVKDHVNDILKAFGISTK